MSLTPSSIRNDSPRTSGNASFQAQPKAPDQQLTSMIYSELSVAHETLRDLEVMARRIADSLLGPEPQCEEGPGQISATGALPSTLDSARALNQSLGKLAGQLHRLERA